jgi:hypothetical protein
MLLHDDLSSARAAPPSRARRADGIPAWRQPVIRPADPSELALLRHLHLAALWCIDMDAHRPEAVAAFVGRMPGPDADLIGRRAYAVMDGGGEILGGAGWAPLADSLDPADLIDADGRPAGPRWPRNTALLRGVFDDPEEGRHAIRRRILAHVAADAARAGYASLETFVPEGAAAGYRAAGFHPVRRLGLFAAGSCVLPVVQLRRALVSEMAAVA